MFEQQAAKAESEQMRTAYAAVRQIIEMPLKNM
jgi:hypothetical protein